MKTGKISLFFWISFAVWQFLGVAGPELVQADGYGRYNRQYEYRRGYGGGGSVYCPNNLWRKECQGYVIEPPRTGYYGHGHYQHFEQNYYGGRQYDSGGSPVILNIDPFGWIPRALHGFNEEKKITIIQRTESDCGGCGAIAQQQSYPQPRYHPPAPPVQQKTVYVSGNNPDAVLAVKNAFRRAGFTVVVSRAGLLAEVDFTVEGDPLARVVVRATSTSRLREVFDGVGSEHFRDGKDPDAILRKRDATTVAANKAVDEVLAQVRRAQH